MYCCTAIKNIRKSILVRNINNINVNIIDPKRYYMYLKLWKQLLCMYNFYLRWYGTPLDINVDKDRRKKKPGYYIKNIQMYKYHTYI